MLRLTRSFPKSPTSWKYAIVRLESRASTTQTERADPETPPPPPPRRSGGVFWKVLGLTVAGAGGVIGYAWYDPEFRKTIEQNVPYSKDALKFVFENIPETIQSYTGQPAAIESKTPAIAPLPDDKSSAVVPTKALPATKSLPETDAAKKPVQVESDRQRAAREAREKKEKAQEALRKREAEEAAENHALETGLESLVAYVRKTVDTAITSHKAATKAVQAHTDQLKKAMEAAATESHWEALTDSQQARADAVWASEQTGHTAREALDKLRQAVADGRSNKTTKRNKALSAADKDLSNFDYELSTSLAELTKARSEAMVLTNYRDLVRKGKRQFSQELEELLPEVKLGEGSSSKLTTSELNSLIAHAHHRVDQLQRQLVEQLAMEPLRVDAALENQRAEDERLTNERIAREQQRYDTELNVLRDSWEAEARVEFESQLRHHLSRQAAAHSDHLVDVLRAQRLQLNGEFDKQLVKGVKEERERLLNEVGDTLARMEAIEAAIDGRARKQRLGRSARELWVACKTLISVIRDGSSPGNNPTPVAVEVNAVRDAGSEYPMVHIALSTISMKACTRGIYTADTLAKRFDKVYRIARRVAMVDQTNASLVHYFLSYVKSFFVLRSAPLRSGDDVSHLSKIALLDNAAYCVRRGNLEQAVRYVNQLSGESRRVAEDWLEEARLLLETRQAADLLLAFASANGLDTLD